MASLLPCPAVRVAATAGAWAAWTVIAAARRVPASQLHWMARMVAAALPRRTDGRPLELAALLRAEGGRAEVLQVILRESRRDEILAFFRGRIVMKLESR